MPKQAWSCWKFQMWGYLKAISIWLFFKEKWWSTSGFGQSWSHLGDETHRNGIFIPSWTTWSGQAKTWVKVGPNNYGLITFNTKKSTKPSVVSWNGLKFWPTVAPSMPSAPSSEAQLLRWDLASEIVGVSFGAKWHFYGWADLWWSNGDLMLVHEIYPLVI